jgi:CarD family transcriptional regulator
MPTKSVKTSTQKAVVAAGKRAAAEAKLFAAEVADAAVAAAVTAKAATKAAAGVVLHKVATSREVKKPDLTSVQDTVVAAGKSTAARALAGEVAGAAAKAKAAAKTAAGVVMNKVGTAIEVRAAKGARAVAGEGTTPAATGGRASSRAKKKVSKPMAGKKRAAPKKKAGTKRASGKVAKEKIT